MATLPKEKKSIKSHDDNLRLIKTLCTGTDVVGTVLIQNCSVSAKTMFKVQLNILRTVTEKVTFLLLMRNWLLIRDFILKFTVMSYYSTTRKYLACKDNQTQ